MNRYKYLLIHGICAALMTALQFRYGIISQATIGDGLFASPDLTWETIHHFMVNTFLVLFLVIPLGFVIQYVYFRVICRESLVETYNDRDASLSSLYASAVLLAVLALSFLPSARAEAQGSKVLRLYGIEILRRTEISIGDFEEYAKQNPQAESVLWKYPGVQYRGTGDVVLSGYFLDRPLAERRKSEVGESAKILDMTLDPFFVAGRNPVYLYRFPKAGGEDSVVGDVWIRSEGRDRLLEKDVLLGYYTPVNTTVFKPIGLSKDGKELLYCRGDCFRYHLNTDRKVADPSLEPKKP